MVPSLGATKYVPERAHAQRDHAAHRVLPARDRAPGSSCTTASTATSTRATPATPLDPWALSRDTIEGARLPAADADRSRCGCCSATTARTTPSSGATRPRPSACPRLLPVTPIPPPATRPTRLLQQPIRSWARSTTQYPEVKLVWEADALRDRAVPALVLRRQPSRSPTATTSRTPASAAPTCCKRATGCRIRRSASGMDHRVTRPRLGCGVAGGRSLRHVRAAQLRARATRQAIIQVLLGTVFLIGALRLRAGAGPARAGEPGLDGGAAWCCRRWTSALGLRTLVRLRLRRKLALGLDGRDAALGAAVDRRSSPCCCAGRVDGRGGTAKPGDARSLLITGSSSGIGRATGGAVRGAGLAGVRQHAQSGAGRRAARPGRRARAGG